MSWTVIGDDYQPIGPADRYLKFLTSDGASPHTLRSYATSLGLWFDFLDHTGRHWDTFPALTFGEFLTWQRTGDRPGEPRIGTPPQQRRPSTVQARSAAVLAFYRWVAAAEGITAPYNTLYSPIAKRGRRPYAPMLAGIAPESAHAAPLYSTRSGPRRRTPVLTPTQITTILDACATQGATGEWHGTPAGLRNRLLFATLAETGMRLGEALALRHNDIRPGQGDLPAIDITPRQDHPHGARVKSGQPRRIYIAGDLQRLYDAYAWSLVDAGADMVVEDLSSHFVFTNVATGSGGRMFAPIRPETVYAAVRSISRRVTPPLPRGWSPHWFRHTHATALLLSGCPPHVVMRRLGHLDVQTTLSIYGWVTEDAELRAVADWRRYADGWDTEKVGS
ncbi:tyrosine-type recombinase/integrase [Dermacoccaceae bacterium W4C1]